ncbi:MAG: hypothetical protein ACRDNJ_16150, partial [Solirubrobacteraceae bacterium]
VVPRADSGERDAAPAAAETAGAPPVDGAAGPAAAPVTGSAVPAAAPAAGAAVPEAEPTAVATPEPPEAAPHARATDPGAAPEPGAAPAPGTAPEPGATPEPPQRPANLDEALRAGADRTLDLGPRPAGAGWYLDRNGNFELAPPGPDDRAEPIPALGDEPDVPPEVEPA